VMPADISGGSSVEDAADIFMNILKGKGTWAQNAVVFSNSAMALYGTGAYKDYETAYYTVVDSLESGKALRAFEQLISLQ
jgi:anthranilate phosphoribosyltransferase